MSGSNPLDPGGGSVLSAIAHPAQVNVLGAYQQAAEAAGRVWDIRKAQAQQVAGQLATESIVNGQFDPNVFAQKITRAGPDVAMYAQPALQQASTLAETQGRVQEAKLTAYNNALASLPPNASRDQIIGTIRGLQAAGIHDSGTAEKMIANLPKDDKELPAYIQQHGLTVSDALLRWQAAHGKPDMLSLGSVAQPVTTSIGGVGQPPAGAVTGASPAISLGLSPSEQVGIVTTKDPASNQEVKEPITIFLTRHGYSLPGAPPASGAQKPGTAPPAATPPPALPPPIASGAAPDVAAKWEASTKQFNEANEAAGNYQARIFPLVQAYNIIKSGTVTTGQAADAWNQVRGALQTFGTKLGIPETGPQSIAQANSEQLVKYTQQYINAQGLSARSDQALASAITGNPGSHISTLANEQVMPAMIGMERMRQMALADFKAQKGWAPRNFSDFMNTWQNTHDPRAFIVDMLDSKQTDKIFADMDGNDAIHKAARKRFQDTLRIVEQNPGIMGQAALPH